MSGFIGPVIAAAAVDSTGTYELAYFYSAIIMGVALVFSVLTKNPAAKTATNAQPEKNESLKVNATA